MCEWFVQPRKSNSNFSERTDDLETNTRESDESGSDYNYNFGEDQGEEAEFSMSDIDDELTNFLKQKFNPLSNEGKRKPLPLKDS